LKHFLSTLDSLQELAQPFHLDRKGEVPAGKQPTYQMPVFTFSVGACSMPPLLSYAFCQLYMLPADSTGFC
jgi:hypothetical protein